MLPDYSLIAWLLIIFSVYLTGVSKGGFAGGFGTLSVPLMALAISPTQAAGLLLPLLLVMDAFAVKAWWGKHDRAEVWRFVPGLFIGVTVGTLLFGKSNVMGFSNMNDMAKELNKMMSGGGLGMQGNTTSIKLDMIEYKKLGLSVGDKVFLDLTKAESSGV